MAPSQPKKVSVGNLKDDTSTITLPRFTIPSQKSVLDFFYSNDVIMKMYAEHVISTMTAYSKGVIKTFPAHLNTASDICDFVFKNRRVRVDDYDTLAEKFLSLAIAPTPTEAKRKRGDDEKSRVVKQKKKQDANSAGAAKQVVKAPPAEDTPGKFNIKIRPRKKLSFALQAIPNFLTFFPSAKASTFSSKGGLHDVTCGICKEIGFYTSKDSEGKLRGLDLGQKAWVAVLHDIVQHDGHVAKEESYRILELTRVKVEAPKEVADDTTAKQSEAMESEITDWAGTPPSE